MKVCSEPEILRVNLASVVLQLLTMGVTNVDTFDFVDKPSQAVSLCHALFFLTDYSPKIFVIQYHKKKKKILDKNY